MQYLEKIDAFILNRLFQPVANRWQELTGKNNFWLARMFFWLYLMGVIWSALTIRDLVSLILNVAFGLYISYGMLRIIGRLEKMERDADSGSLESKMNPLGLFFPHGVMRTMISVVTIFMVWSGLLLIFQLGFDVSIVSSSVTSIVLWVALYLSACSPLRPPPLKAGNFAAATSAS